MEHRDLFARLIRRHVLHHAAEGDVYGQWMIQELARHGYRLSPGTIYPLLHGLEDKGYLESQPQRAGARIRRVYRATPEGRAALQLVRSKVRELLREILSDS